MSSREGTGMPTKEAQKPRLAEEQKLNQESTQEAQLLSPDFQHLEQFSLECSQIFSADPVSVAGTFHGISVSPFNIP